MESNPVVIVLGPAKGPEQLALYFGVGAICSYEASMIMKLLMNELRKNTGVPVPTVSHLCGTHPSLIPIILVGLALHLMPEVWAWLVDLVKTLTRTLVSRAILNTPRPS